MAYTVIVNLAPQDVTEEEYIYIRDRTKSGKETILQSADDAVRLVNDPQYATQTSKVRVWGAERWKGGDIVQWLVDRGAPNVEVKPLGNQYVILDVVDSLPKHPTKKYSTRSVSGITTITVHHAVSPCDRTPEAIASYHVSSNDWPGIGYHFYIVCDGTIYQTNRLETMSYHCGYANGYSVGLCIGGNFQEVNPTDAQLDAARWLVSHLAGERLPGLREVRGHRDMPYAQTACPGNTYRAWLPYVGGNLTVLP